MTRKTAQMTACSLRSFLRFLHAEKLTDAMLADAIPAVAHRRLSGLPEPLNQAQVIALLGACDRTTPVGRRDFAVITLLCRLGLRCGEVSGLLLSDLDWRAGVVTIHGKAAVSTACRYRSMSVRRSSPTCGTDGRTPPPGPCS